MSGGRGKPGDGEDSLLSRWAARREAVAREEAERAAAEEKARRDEAEREAREAEAIANREAAEAIDLENADYDTDFTAFLKAGVPDALRRKALRALWRTNPVLANLDGLNDYDEDFRDAGAAVEAIRSTWEAGRGYAARAESVRDEMEAREAAGREARRGRQETDETAPAAAGDGDGDGDQPTAAAAGDVAETGEAEAVEAATRPAAQAGTRTSLRKRLLDES